MKILNSKLTYIKNAQTALKNNSFITFPHAPKVMARFQFRRRMRPNFARARRVVRAVSGRIIVARVLVSKASIPDVTSVDFDNPLGFDLIGAAEAQNHEIESTGGTTIGTDVATAPLYSKVVAIKLQTMVHGSSAGGELVRWQLVKNPQGDLSTANINASWHSSNDDATEREVRGFQLAKGQLLVSPSRLQTPVRIFIRRKTMARLGSLREADRLRFVVSKDATGTTLQLTMWGNIYLRANA